MSFSKNVNDRERDKFVETSDNETAVRVIETYEGDGTVGGTPIQHDFNEAIDVVKDAVVNHDFIVNDGEIVELHQINIHATDVAEFILQIGDGAAVEVFVDKDHFDITLPLVIPFKKPIIVTGTPDGLTIRIAKTNLSNQTQSLYSKMILVVR
jgi:hypothetical protein